MTTDIAALVVLSGGVDSTVAAYAAAERHPGRVAALSFDYGQRHRTEIQFASATSGRLGMPWQIVDLTGIAALLSTSALTDPGRPVPEGHYADETMRATVVPNRNAILLNIAAAAAIGLGAAEVWTGVHAGDHPVYPDCRPEFIDAVTEALRVGNAGHIAVGFEVVAPFLHSTKAQVVEAGARLGVPFVLTWSCYVGGPVHCGRCSTCVERIEAFRLAGVADPTEYADLSLYEELAGQDRVAP